MTTPAAAASVHSRARHTRATTAVANRSTATRYDRTGTGSPERARPDPHGEGSLSGGRRELEQIADPAGERVAVERLRHHIANAAMRESLPGAVGRGGHEEHRHLAEAGAAADEVEDVDPVQTGQRDIEDEEVWTRRGELVENEGPVRHDVGGNREPIFDVQLEGRHRVRVVLSDKDSLHTRSMARKRRKTRSFVQSLQPHMSGVWMQRPCQAGAWGLSLRCRPGSG